MAGASLHASCAARHDGAVLIQGPPGSGKSDLVLRLLPLGFTLVADDRVDLVDGAASPPAALAGLLEIRGLGIIRLPFRGHVPVALVVRLGQAAPARLPHSARDRALDLPMMDLDAFHPSAPHRVAAALDCAIGRIEQVAGLFT